MQHRLIRIATGLALSLTLSALMGCAGMNRLQAEVSTHPQWPAGIPTGTPTYQWDRLPSLRSGPQARDQDALEVAANESFARAGWRLDTQQPQWTVQVDGQTQRPPSPPPSHFNLGIGIGIGVGHGHIQLGSMWPATQIPMDRSQVVVLIRPVGSGPIAYESRATREAWGQPNAAQWRALVQAALRDFPLSRAQQNTVTIDLAPKDKAKP
jgi:hypothetical protein